MLYINTFYDIYVWVSITIIKILGVDMKNVVLVLGYNNTRVNDVKKIRQKSKEYLNAETVLCKKSPTPEDAAAADYVIDVGLEGTETNVQKVLNSCKELNLKVIALLPFSDPGTQLGAALANHLNLNGPVPGKIISGLDKSHFREQEKHAALVPTGYKKVKSQRITSFEQLQQMYQELNGKLFLKPAKEGNSRGCINLTKEKSLESAWSEVSKYLEGGVIAEELIDEAKEYSWDHVCGYSWVTEKKTTQNEYRAEIQQILPAPISSSVFKCISSAGSFMSDLSGSNNSACHNEVFFNEKTNNVIAVEPNLRPAGMRIWDLAAIAFENLDPWKEWVLWAAGINNSESKELVRNYYVGIRMIQAEKSGVLKEINSINIAQFTRDDFEIVELTWTKKSGDSITTVVKDNSEFIGFVIAKSKNYSQLANYLNEVCNTLCKEAIIQ